MITSSEIKVRIQGEKSLVWINEAAIVRELGIAESYLRKKRSEYKDDLPKSWAKLAENQEYWLSDTGKSWRYGYKKGQYWYCVDNIPNRKPAMYRDRLPSVEELVEITRGIAVRSRDEIAWIKREISRGIEEVMIEGNDTDYFIGWQHPISNKRVLNALKAAKLSESVAWVVWMQRTIKDNAHYAMGFKTVDEFYAFCAEEISGRKLSCFVRTTGRSLRNRVTQLSSDRNVMREQLISLKYGNRNAAIIERAKSYVDESTGEVLNIDIHSTIALAYWMNINSPGKSTKVKLYNKYVSDVIALGERPISLSLFTKYLSRWDISYATSKERHGKDYFRKMIKSYVPSKKLEYANSLWCADASGTMSYRYYTKDGKIKSRKLYTAIIGDVATGYIAGHTVGVSGQSSENFGTMRTAMANAVANPLNEGREVLEFVSDNHGAYSSDVAKLYLRDAARVVRRITPGNSQGNPAERMFRVFKQSLRGVYNMLETSFGAQSMENVANPDYVNVDMLPTYEEAKRQLDQLIWEHNNRVLADGTTPEQRFLEAKNPEAKQLSEQAYNRLTLKPHKAEISRSRGFVEVVERGERVKYELPIDIASRRAIANYVGYRSTVNVMLYATEKSADMYDESGLFIMTLPRATEASQSQYEATQSNYDALDHYRSRQEIEEDQTDQFVEDVERDFLRVRGGDRYALEMAIGNYEDPKGEYNHKQEESRSVALAGRIKSEKAERKRKAKTAKEAEKVSDSQYMDFINRSLQNFKDKNNTIKQ